MKNRPIKSYSPGNFKIFLFFCFYWIFFVLLTQTLFSGFHLIDDSLYLLYKNKIDSLGLWPAFLDSFKDDLAVRFRPISILYYNVVSYLFNFSFLFIAIINLGITISSSFFFYLFARNLKLTVFQSIGFVFLLYTGNQGSISYWLATNENIGMFFISVSLWYGSQSYFTSKKFSTSQLPEVIFFVLAALCKESFVLLFPAILLGRYIATSVEKNISFREYLLANKTYFVLYLITSAVILYFIVFVTGINTIGYAGIDRESFNPGNIANTAIRLIFTKGYGAALLVGALIVLIRWRMLGLTQKKYVLYLLILYLLITVPQIILYSKSQIFMRYLLPGLLGSALLIVICWKMVGQEFELRILKNVFVGTLILIFGVNLFLMIRGANHYAKQGRLNKELFSTIRENTSRESKILLIADPVTQTEPVLAFATYLQSPLTNRKNIFIHPYNRDSSNLAIRQKEAIRNFEKTIGVNYALTDTNWDNVACAVLFPLPENIQQPQIHFEHRTKISLERFDIWLKKKSE